MLTRNTTLNSSNSNSLVDKMDLWGDSGSACQASELGKLMTPSTDNCHRQVYCVGKL